MRLSDQKAAHHREEQEKQRRLAASRGLSYKSVPGLERKLCVIPDFKTDSRTGHLVGYASTWDNLDRQGEYVLKGAFAKSLPRFLHDGFGAVGHDWSQLPVATVKSAVEDHHGLKVELEWHSTAEAQAARTVTKERLERGKTASLSIGYKVVQDEHTEKGRGLKELELYEVSLVTVPANELAQVASVKSYKLDASPSLARRQALRRFQLKAARRRMERSRAPNQNLRIAELERDMARLRLQLKG